MPNPNHPVKNSQTKVDPIKSIKDIKSIKKLLKNNLRDYALFIIGVNTNLRASDLVNITAKQVQNLKPGDDLVLTEQKTGKGRRITLNAVCVAAIENLLASQQALEDEAPLFRSRKGGKLCVQSVHRLVKGWCRQINLTGNP